MRDFNLVRELLPDELDVKITILQYAPNYSTFQTTFNVRLKSYETGERIKSIISEKIQSRNKIRLLFRGQQFHDNAPLRFHQNSGENHLELYAVEEKSILNNIRIWERNVAECALSARHGLCNRDREKFNKPVTPTPPLPDCSYLGNLLTEIGETCISVSENLQVMSDILSNIGAMQEDQPYEHNRRIVQNNMDCLRYAAPMFRHLIHIKFPINQPDAEITEDP